MNLQEVNQAFKNKETHISLEETNKLEEEIELYGDPGIASGHAKVPQFLIFSYLFWPLWGIVTFCYFWNGTQGWLDGGYWEQLQIAANTTFPIQNQYMLPVEDEPKTQTTQNQ